MRLLALETSAYVSSIALWEDGAVAAESFPSRMDLCEKLTARIQALLDDPTRGPRPLRGHPATGEMPALEAIAVSQGPGSFTGLRVGMATAKALAHVLGVPLVGVPTQEAIAAAVEAGEGERLLVLQQARRDHVYAGIWAKSAAGATELAAPHVVAVSELPDLMDGVSLITGPATEMLGELLAQLPPTVSVRQVHAQAATVAMLAARRVAAADSQAAFTLQPLYLLPSQAERMQGLDLSAPPKPRRLLLRRGTLHDLAEVVRIENASFSSPWSEVSLREELSPKPGNLFLVAELDGRLVGYAGAWIFAGEAHICTIAVDPACRRCGLGAIMMLELLAEALREGAAYVILEYRVSNSSAAELYGKLGFAFVHRRRAYYRDTNEDAVVAAITDMTAPEQQERLRQASQDWRRGHDYEVCVDL
jgi:ribosomal-protein-alanine N-acetyltransferase